MGALKHNLNIHSSPSMCFTNHHVLHIYFIVFLLSHSAPPPSRFPVRMAKMAAVEEQWEVKKKKLQDELERVERMFADAYDRCVCVCAVCVSVVCVMGMNDGSNFCLD